jgi:hypothetical protein
MNNQTKTIYTSDNPNLNYNKVIIRIINGNLDYFLGRFLLVRSLYSQYRKIKQVIQRKKVGLKSPTQIKSHETFNVDNIVDLIYQNSYFDQLEMNEDSVNFIVDFAKTQTLISSNDVSEFTYHEYISNLKSKEKFAIARVKNVVEADKILQLRHDEFLLEIAEKYLGYYPENCDIMMWWSFANSLSSEDRRKQFQTIDYHYDVHGLNFFYISFYLTNVDIKSGAHILVKSSHRKKKISMLFRSARFPDKIINKNYSQEDIITIEGKAGKCFLEDASCFHKALSPIEKDRLFLQLRFF